MNELRLKYPVPMMRRIMNVSASGYYAWVDRPLSKRAQEEVRLELEIMAAHQRNRQTYGPERLQRDLAEHGVRVGVCRIKRIRQKLGIRCKQKRRFKTTTNSAHRLPVADNLLGQQFKVSQPNAVWVSDITYIPTDEGWLYLAGHKDLFTGELVGYAMGERMTRNLVSQSLFRALRAKRPARGLMHHSDRGSQYCSQEYRNLMERSGLRSSMSGNGNCFDGVHYCHPTPVRDGMKCQQCGARTGLAVHHTKGMKSHALSNLVTLCRTCHQAVHRPSQQQTV